MIKRDSHGLLTRCPGSRSCSWPGTCVDRAATERRATENVYWPSLAWEKLSEGGEGRGGKLDAAKLFLRVK